MADLDPFYDSTYLRIKPWEVFITDQNLTLMPATLSMVANTTEQLNAVVYPRFANNRDVIWISNNPSVADVDPSGKVTAGSKTGIATITCRAVDSARKATIRVTVKNYATPVRNVTLPKERIMFAGEEYSLKANVLPLDANNKAVTWSPQYSPIARCDTDGKLTALSKGTVTITCKTDDGNKTAPCKVTVYDTKTFENVLSYVKINTLTLEEFVKGCADYFARFLINNYLCF